MIASRPYLRAARGDTARPRLPRFKRKVAVERDGEKEKKPRPDGREDGKKKNNNNKIIGERCRKTKPNDGRLFLSASPTEQTGLACQQTGGTGGANSRAAPSLVTARKKEKKVCVVPPVAFLRVQ